MKVAYIHGAEQRNRKQSLDDLLEGLRRGAARASRDDLIPNLDIVDVFYGDLLDGLKPTQRFEGSPPDTEAAAEAVFISRCLCCAQGSMFQVFAAVLKATGTPLSAASWIIPWVVPDVSLDQHPVLRAAVRARVANALADAQPDVIIAHSLGTVILADVLAGHHDQLNPRLLVTAGGPLGRPGLFTVDASWRGTDPPQAWLNLIDPTDAVTGAIPMSSTKFPTVWNHIVDNDHYSPLFGKTGGSGATHHLTHYLTHPLTAHLLSVLAHDSEVKRSDVEGIIATYTPPTP